ncbi:hypothetical protein Nmel_013517 [Mimus melanotis]
MAVGSTTSPTLQLFRHNLKPKHCSAINELLGHQPAEF